jgi:hypothetical protein
LYALGVKPGWDALDDYDRGYYCGRLAGQYGMGVLTGQMAAKLLQKLKAALGRTKGPTAPKGPKCFPAGTLVHTSIGLKAIEEMALGDRVMAYDHRELRWVEREVMEVFQLEHQGAMAAIQVKGETIRATGGHPFWVVRGDRLAERPFPVRIAPYVPGGLEEGRWVLARDLQAGDEVLLRHGEIVALQSVRLDEVEERVYNFHVADLQNYAVGVCGVLVHNTNDPAGQTRPRDWVPEDPTPPWESDLPAGPLDPNAPGGPPGHYGGSNPIPNPGPLPLGKGQPVPTKAPWQPWQPIEGLYPDPPPMVPGKNY